MIDFIFLGDSLTFGYGVKPKDNWVHKLSEYLKLNILNKGVNGNTTTDMLFRFYEDNPSLYSAFFCKVSGYVSMILDILSLFPIAAHTRQTALWRSLYESIFPMKDISFQG